MVRTSHSALVTRLFRGRSPYPADGHQFSIELSHQFTGPDGSDVEAIPAQGDDGTATAGDLAADMARCLTDPALTGWWVGCC